MMDCKTEGYIVGDLVLCIGQSAIRIGREVKSLNGKVPYFQEKVSPIFVFVDDFGISDALVKKSDYYYRYPRRCSTYFEGFSCGHHIVEYILTILESSDTCQAITLLYSADEGLGSGVTAFLVQYITKCLPGLVTLAVGILPHMSQGGLASVNTCLVLEQCLEFASCCLLRRMDDTTDLLSNKKPSPSSVHASVYEDVSRCLAADILLAIREIQWLLSLCSARNKLVDVRSSLWQDALKSGSKSSGGAKSSSGSGSGSGSSGENTHHQSLRLLSSNLHSLHLSVSPGNTHASTPLSPPPPPPSAPTPSLASTSHSPLAPPGIVSITHASVLSVSKATPSSRTFSDIDFHSNAAQTTVLAILHGATQPSVRWSQAMAPAPSSTSTSTRVSPAETASFAQHRLCLGPLLPLPTARHGASSGSSSSGGMLSHLTAVCFTSPYAIVLLQEVVSKATRTAQAGAYAYWLNNEHFRSAISSEEVTPPGAAPTDQIKLSLHNLQEYLLRAQQSQSVCTAL